MIGTDEAVEFKTWLESISSRHTAAELELIQRAYLMASRAHAHQKRSSGKPYIDHCLAVTKLLSELHLDSETLAAALLHDVLEDTKVTNDEIRQVFGDTIARLVDGVTKLTQIEHMDGRSKRAQKEEVKAESLRKMFLAMLDDVRVVMIKLADRLHNIRTLGALPEYKQKRIARETLEIFAPLADRLGIWEFKSELEDLSLYYLDPEAYREISTRLEEYYSDRDKHLDQGRESLKAALQAANIQADVYNYLHHTYTIYQTTRRKAAGRDQTLDLGDVHIIVETWLDCYRALGVIHSLWKPIPGEFDDYIATPKDNMYRSLHTAVVGPDGKRLSLKIRTSEMHKVAQLGIAAHWRYEGQQYETGFDQKIAWLHQLMEWREEVGDAHEFVDSLKSDVFQDRVYTFTPRGDIIDLPLGATPVDFAYNIHTEVGHRCRGARVNGQLVSLDYQLGSGDQVEILTAKRGGPSRDWLNPYMGFVATSRARGKIRHWFRRLGREEIINEGRSQLDRELKRLGLEDLDREQLAVLFNFDDVDSFLIAIGIGDVTGYQVINRITQHEQVGETPLGITTEPAPTPTLKPDDVRVSSNEKLPVRLAQCCKPARDDLIVGYRTRRSGITVHRQDCRNVLNQPDQDRLVRAQWVSAMPATYSAHVIVEAYDRPGLLHDITNVVARQSINVSAVNVATRKQDQTATIGFTLDVTDLDQLSRVLTRIERLASVVEVRSLESEAIEQVSRALPRLDAPA
jgi:GTP pyrophosphokinase